MKNCFIVSLIKNGILGGGMTADAEAITYHTGKVTVPAEFRRLVMKYRDIRQVETGRMLLMPTVTVKMQNGEEYKFAVFFGQKRLLEILREKGVQA